MAILISKSYSTYIAAIVLLNCTSSVAIGQIGAIKGAGLNTCGEYLEVADNKTIKMGTVSWGLGYLTRANRDSIIANNNFKSIPSHTTVAAYLHKYCTDNPLKRIYDAFDALYDQLEFETLR